MSASGDSIGQASMTADGTLSLRLHGETPDGAYGDALFRYAPDDPDYARILAHVGNLRPGETKPVPPWDDDPDA